MGEYGQYTVPTADVLVNFNVGQPATNMLPLDKIRQAAAERFKADDPTLLQYGYTSGYKSFRNTLAKYLSPKYNMDIDPETLFVTCGVTSGLALLCTIFAKTGDTVFVEEPTYFLALRIFEDFGITAVSIPVDENGLKLDALRARMEGTDGRGPAQNPLFVYTIPSSHNPTGFTLTEDRRAQLVEMSEEFGFYVVADEVYQLLSFLNEDGTETTSVPKPMCAFDKVGTVFSLGSFSKILAPSLRLGWIQGPKHLLDKISDSGQLDSSGGMNPVIASIVHSAIDLGLQEEHLVWTRTTLGTRCKLLLDALDSHFPPGCGVTWNKPLGGYFIWVSLPEDMDAAQLLEVAKSKHKVSFLPGGKFTTVPGGLHNNLRLSFSFYDAQDLVEGVRRLAAAVDEFKKSPPAKTAPAAATSTDKSAKPVRVAVHGATGKLGSLIVSQLEAAAPSDGVVYAGGVPRSGAVPACDVVVDVSLPEGLRALIPRLSGQALVVGTTGDLPKKELRAYARDKSAPVVISANFSVGVPLLCDLVKSATASLPDGWQIEVSETHHTAKRDAPSGTALRLAEAAGGVDSDKMHSLRLGDTVGDHTVYLAGPGERVELSHRATRREVFAIGAVRLASWLVKQQPRVHFH